MELRIFGQENEIGFATAGKALEQTVIQFLNLIRGTDLKPLVMAEYSEIGCKATYWLRNGAKLYKDSGEHPEYATPECSSVKDLVAHDKASEEIFKKLWRAAKEAVRNGDLDFGKIMIAKNNIAYNFTTDGTPFQGFSWGLHENYLTESRFTLQFLAEQLLPHLIARVVFIGGGHIQPDVSGWSYLLSSRLDYINMICSSASTGNYKPLVLDRLEPLADSHRWHRIQVISGEANMLELPIYLKYMTTHFCLRLIEDGWRLPPGFNFKENLGVTRILNRDIYCTAGLPMDCGIAKTAVGIERFYLNEAKTLRPLSDEERLGLELWEWILDLLSRDLTRVKNFMKLFGVLDWATKWRLVKRKMDGKNLPLKHPKILGLNIAYSSLDDSPRQSVWQYLLTRHRERPFMFRVVSDDDIAKAVNNPPLTRAKVRSDFINLLADFPDKLNVFSFDWGKTGYSLRYRDREKSIAGEIDFGFSDPFTVSNEALENLRKFLIIDASG